MGRLSLYQARTGLTGGWTFQCFRKRAKGKRESGGRGWKKGGSVGTSCLTNREKISWTQSRAADLAPKVVLFWPMVVRMVPSRFLCLPYVAFSTSLLLSHPIESEPPHPPHFSSLFSFCSSFQPLKFMFYKGFYIAESILIKLDMIVSLFEN